MANEYWKWKPGQSGNPNGRPKKGQTLTDILEQKLNKDDFVEALIKLAKEGNVRALEMIYERIDGKVKERLEHEGGLEIIFKNLTKKKDE